MILPDSDAVTSRFNHPPEQKLHWQVALKPYLTLDASVMR